MKTNCLVWLAGTLFCWIITARSLAEQTPVKVTYQDHIQPIFREKCFSCHNPDKKSGGLDLTSYTSVMLGGASGEVIEPGSPDGSYLYQLITHQSEPFMPAMSDPIPKSMQDLIKAWIEQGALENAGSKPLAIKKPKNSVALSGPTLERPAEIPMPGHLELEPAVVTEAPGTVTAMASSPWAPLIAVAGQKQIVLYHTHSLELLGILPFPEGLPFVLRFSRNGALLLAGGGRGAAYGRVVVWDVPSGERLIEVGDELDAVLAADISSDQSVVALGGPQKVVRVFNTSDGQLRYELRKHTDWVLSLEFSPDGVLLASGDRAGNLFVWEAMTGREYLTLKGHTAAITGLSWRADSNVLASCSEDGTVRLWEMENGNQIKSWNAHGQGVLGIEFARDGRLVTTGRDRVAKLWNQDGTLLRSFDPLEDIGVSVTLCDETNRVVGGDWRGTLRVWDAAQGTVLGTLVPNPPSIKTRLEQLQQQLVQRQSEAEPVAKAAEEAAAEWKKLSELLAAVGKSRTDGLKRLEVVAASLTAAQQKKAELQKQAETLASQNNALDAAVKALTNAVTAAVLAAKELPEDQELAQWAKAAESMLKARQERQRSIQQALTEAHSTLEQLEKAIADHTAEHTRRHEEIKQLEAELARLEPLVKAADEKKQAAQAAATQAQEAVVAVKRQLERWQQEQQFVEYLRGLRAQQAEFERQAQAQGDRLAQMSDALAKLEKQLAEANSRWEGAQTEYQKSRDALQQASRQLESQQLVKKQAEERLTGAQQETQRLEQAIVALNEAVQKTQVAVDVAKEPELAGVIEGLKKLLERKQGEFQKLRESLPMLEKAVEEAKAAVATADMAYRSAQQMFDNHAAIVAQQQKLRDEVAAQLEEARKVYDTAQAEFQRLINQADAVAVQIRQAKTQR